MEPIIFYSDCVQILRETANAIENIAENILFIGFSGYVKLFIW